MAPLVLALTAFLALAASGSAGFALARSRTSRGPGPALCGFAGLLALLTIAAAVVALSGAREAASAQATALRRLAVEAVAFDSDLKLYGPDAAPVRERLRSDLSLARAALAGEPAARLNAFDAASGNFAAMAAAIAGLQPATEPQRRLLASAQSHSDAFARVRLDMALQAGDPSPQGLAFAALTLACATFLALGALGRANAAAVAALLFGAGALAGAYYIVAEPAALAPVLDQAIAEVGR